MTLRIAAIEDVPVLETLIARSAHGLSGGDYTTAQVAAALRGAFGVDTRLVRDGTYFVAEADGRIVECGGWSHRRTLFGGDARADRDDERQRGQHECNPKPAPSTCSARSD